MKTGERGEFSLDKSHVARSFNRAAPTYRKRAVLQSTVAERLIGRLNLFRLSPASILDVGSGCGNGTRQLRRIYPRARVIAFDIAMEMLRVARGGRWRQWLSRRNFFVCGDAERLPFANQSLDLVFSNLTLQWCTDLAAALQEIRRVLKPEGLFLFTTLGPDTLMELRKSWADADAETHVNLFLDMHDIGDALIRAGLSGPVMDVERITLTYADACGVMRDLKAIGAHNVNRGRSLHLTGKAKLRQVVARYEDFRQDGVVPATYEIVYGHAWAPAPGARPQDGSTVAMFPLSQLQRREIK